MKSKRSEKRTGLTRREFVQSSSRVGATVAGAALISSLPRTRALASPSVVWAQEVISGAGAVATELEEVARVGAGIVERGGNAMDAAAAACLAGCIMQPHLSDLGGYVCCAVVLEAKADRVWSLDSNSVAPEAAHERMFKVLPLAEGPRDINENEYGCRIENNANVYGPLAVGVPGTLGGVGRLWERWGSLKWSEIVAPSLTLLENGFAFGPTAEAIKQKEPMIRRYEPSVRHLLPDGKVPGKDQIWHRPDMKKTLERISASGWRDFYEGEIGQKIADYVAGLGGILTRKDMSRFDPRVSEPYQIVYRDAKVFGAILPNGGLSSLQILNMLECFEPVPDRTAAYWHRLAEILKLAWRDRLSYVGDPDFATVPVARLLNKEYAAGRTETIRQFPNHVDRLVPALPEPSPHGTMHVSAADKTGNLVAITISHGGLFGSCLTVPGTGITLGHGMCRFDPHPGLVNSVGALKRPLNNVSPTIVRLPDRDVALGLRGGRRIVNVSAQLAQRIIDFKSTVSEATAAPRLVIQAKEPGEVANSLEPSIVKELVSMGHELKPVPGLVMGAHGAEFLKRERKVRSGGNSGAAGVG